MTNTTECPPIPCNRLGQILAEGAARVPGATKFLANYRERLEGLIPILDCQEDISGAEHSELDPIRIAIKFEVNAIDYALSEFIDRYEEGATA